MFDVPCNLNFSYICSVEVPSAIDTQKDLMIGAKGGSWPSCISTGQMFAGVCSFSK